MKRTHLIALLIATALLQLAVPAFMIWREEDTLKQGQVFKFKTQPVDPYDMFRGRYVALAFAEETLSIPPEKQIPDLENGGLVYAEVETGEDGFAHIQAIHRTPPVGKTSFRVSYRYGRVEFPFDRYYLEESKAPRAEQVYRENSNRKNDNAYVTVHIKNGHATLGQLFIQDQPVEQFLEKQGH